MSAQGVAEAVAEELLEEILQEVEKEDNKNERYIYYLGDFTNINLYVRFPNSNLMQKTPILEVKIGDLLFTSDDDFFTVEEIQKFEMVFGDDEPEKLMGIYVSEDTYKPNKTFVMEKNGRIFHFPPLNNSKLIDKKTCPDDVYKIVKAGKPRLPCTPSS
jgi:hypothetical protein